MATTTNYGWETPDNTDLVRDGAEAIRDLGEAIDNTVYLNSELGGGMTLLSTTTLTGASTTISSIPQTFINLEIWVVGMTNATGNSGPNFRLNGTLNLIVASGTRNNNGTTALASITNSNIETGVSGLRTDANNAVRIRINNYASTTNHKNIDFVISMLNVSSQSLIEEYSGYVKTNTAISSLVCVNGGGDWLTGTVQIWGIS